ncbi:MAG: hypothetical protein ACI8YQ_001091 [Polaribacter sp.]|jgi:hypothetical protein
METKLWQTGKNELRIYLTCLGKGHFQEGVITDMSLLHFFIFGKILH